MKSATPRFVLSLSAVLVISWVTATFTASRTTLWDRDESRYGTAALEMASSGNLLFPTFNHELRAFQPAMIYWLMSASTKVLGPTETAVRFPSTVAFAVVILLTALIARRLGGETAGLAAAVVAATSPLLFVIGTAATTDAVLLAFILLAQWIFVEALCEGWRRWHLPAMGLAIGGGLLTKGPLGLLIPVLCALTALALSKGRNHAGGWRLAIASLIGIALFLAWGLPANAATDGNFWRIAIVERLPARIFTAMEGHGGGNLAGYLLHLPFYLFVLAVGFFPWTLYTPGALASWLSRNAAPQPGSAAGARPLLAAMILPPLVLFTLLATKLPHYIAPVIPWLAVAIALPLTKEALPAVTSRIVQLCSFATAGASAVLACALLVAPLVHPALSEFQKPMILAGILLLASVAAALPAQISSDFKRAARVQAGAMLVFFWMCALAFLPHAEAVAKPGQTLGKIAASQLEDSDQVATFEWTEPGIHFYLGGRKINYLPDRDALLIWSLEPGAKAFILRAERHAELVEAGHLADYEAIAEASGHDHVRGGHVRLVMIRRP